MAHSNLRVILCLLAVIGAALLGTAQSGETGAVAGTVVDAKGDGSTGFGTLGRNPFRGPFQQNWDASLSKVWTITERQNLRFSADLFNVWNHPVFDVPLITDIESPAFGQITNTIGNPRLTQFSLRYGF